MTPEQRRRISEGKMGRPNGRLGSRHSIETRKRISEITRSRTQRGAQHYAWKGGSKQAKHGDRGTPEYKQWRRAVFERDGYTCLVCGEYRGGGDLEAHHIKPYSTHPHLRFDVENGVTLCNYHHQREVHDNG